MTSTPTSVLFFQTLAIVTKDNNHSEGCTSNLFAVFTKKTQTKTCFLPAFNIRLALEFSARVWVITEVNYSLPEVIRLQGIHERKITI